jgi:hypothetical protein
MAQDPTQIKSLEYLIAQARFHPAGALPTETHQSFPVPVPSAKGLRVAFLYCTSRASPQEGVLLLPPGYLAYLDAASGKFEELKAVTPAEFGQPHVGNEFIGHYKPAEGTTIEEFSTMARQLFQDYDLLMPAFAAADTNISAEVKRAAAEFRTLFPRVTEAPLQPYYQAVGHEFFAWLSKIAP